VLTFLAPDFSLTGKIVYAYITYTAMTMIYTAINVPYAALMGVITPNAMERTVISSYRFVGVFTALFIVQAAFLSIVNTYFADNEALGYRTVMIGVSALSVILFFITFLTTKERVAPPKEQKTVLRRDLAELFKNKPWLFVAGATVFQLVLISMRNAAIMYYFKYYIGRENLALFGKEIPWSGVSAFMLFGTVLTILGAISTKWFTTFLNKGRAYVLFMFLTAIFVAAVIFIKPDQIELLFLFQALASFSMGPLSVLQWSIYTDTADYGEWKFSHRATGLLMAASLFALKLGLALGSAILGWLMNAYGFVANVAQSELSLTGIRMVMSVYPAIAAICAIVIMIFYPLTNKKMEEIEIDLSARRETEK
ncbi:MFS transporter, partial [candidate division KSB1 bacterium]